MQKRTQRKKRKMVSGRESREGMEGTRVREVLGLSWSAIRWRIRRGKLKRTRITPRAVVPARYTYAFDSVKETAAELNIVLEVEE